MRRKALCQDRPAVGPFKGNRVVGDILLNQMAYMSLLAGPEKLGEGLLAPHGHQYKRAIRPRASLGRGQEPEKGTLVQRWWSP